MWFGYDQIKIFIFEKLNGLRQGNRGPDGRSIAIDEIGDLVIRIDVQDLDQSGHGGPPLFTITERITQPGHEWN